MLPRWGRLVLGAASGGALDYRPIWSVLRVRFRVDVVGRSPWAATGLWVASEHLLVVGLQASCLPVISTGYDG